MVDLPCLDLSLEMGLPKVLSPAVVRLCEAIAADDEIAGDAVIDEVLDELDTAVGRERLARGGIALRDPGGLAPQLAAGAGIDPARGARARVFGRGGRAGGR